MPGRARSGPTRAGRIAVAVLTAAAFAAAVLPAGASAQIAWKVCGRGNEFACAKLAVPLDPSGALPGTISLSLRRHRASVGEARTAIIALAGGPGQAAIPFAEQFDQLLGRVAATRDLIVFDQRGTGLSHPLACHAFETPLAAVDPSRAVSTCAAQLGPTRSFYTSADTVADIEAIRQAGGYEKLVLYGTSYGTKVAELYAEAHPEHVEALVLDSVVTPAGPDTLNRPTFAALPRVLGSICRQGACRGVTSNPLTDLARVVRRMHRAPLKVVAVSRRGRPRTLHLTAVKMLELLIAGDFSGALRAAFVTDVRAAALGDTAPLARLFETVGSGEQEGEEFDGPLYFATSCEEQSFPFNRSASSASRLAEARAAALRLPPATFAPFDATDAIELSDIPACARWPYPPGSSAPPASAAPLPAVPTLILSGSEDLRTPTSGAVELAHEIPGAQLLVVPHTGHSVLGEDPSSCSSTALQALFEGHQVKPCRASPAPSSARPAPLPPRNLGGVRPLKHTHGVPGQTARAVELTLSDLERQFELLAEASGLETLLTGGLQTGGLRSGWAALHGTTLSFHHYSYIPGVTLNGSIKPEIVDLRVSGPDAVSGTLRLGAHHDLTGSLSGEAVSLPEDSNASAAIVASDAAAGGEIDHLHPGGAGPQRPGSGAGIG